MIRIFGSYCPAEEYSSSIEVEGAERDKGGGGEVMNCGNDSLRRLL